jgi:biopolymer transport protein ExbD
MGASGKQDEDELIATINVTPLVDIVLVLLIVLMVTSSYLVNKAISVELPKAATGETTDPSMSISVDQAGKLYLDGVAIDAPALRERVRVAHESNPDVKAIISADGRVHHSEVVSVIDLLRSQKVTKFAINTSPIEQSKAK